MTTRDDKWFDENLGMLTDEGRAAVLKTHIEETEKTKRFIAEQEQQTIRERENSERYQFVRGMIVVAIGLACIGTIIASCNSYTSAMTARVQVAEIQARPTEPRRAPPPASASASAPHPAESAK